MEQTSETVAEGKLIHESSYGQRAARFTEVQVGGVKIDFYDTKNKVIHETKRTNSIEKAHEWQLKYYIYKLKQNGIDGVTGILEYPKLKLKNEYCLAKEDIDYIESFLPEVEKIMRSKTCPPKISIKLCKKCAYYDFCWSGED